MDRDKKLNNCYVWRINKTFNDTQKVKYTDIYV